MARQPDDSAARDQRVQAILHDYLVALDKGQAPDRDEIFRQHPELADELRVLFADQDQMDAPARSLRATPVAPIGVSEPPTTPPDETRAPEAALGPVRSFGDYELLEEIARGGMGIVHRARQVSLNRVVALKIILAGQLSNSADTSPAPGFRV
jgi:hypothetical protein